MSNPTVPDNLSPRHEVTVWHARPFVIGAISFFTFMGIILTIVGGLTVSWTHQSWPPHGPVTSPASDAGWNTTAVQLQTDPPKDLQALREAEYRHLHTVRWTDDSHAYASIPIEQAMTLLVQAQADHQLNTLLPEPKPATPVDLQNQKSSEVVPAPKAP